MDPQLADVLATLANAYGQQEARRIFGSYRLAETIVALNQENVALKAAAQPPSERREGNVPTPLRGETGETA